MQSFSPNWKNMSEKNIHIDPQNVPESPVSLLMRGMAGVIQEKDAEMYQLRQEREYYKEQAQELPQTCIVAEGKQGEIIAALNVLYEAGLVASTKKEYMQRMADALGCPSIADYSRPLNKIKQAYKYEEFFDKLKETALKERDKND